MARRSKSRPGRKAARKARAAPRGRRATGGREAQGRSRTAATGRGRKSGRSTSRKNDLDLPSEDRPTGEEFLH